jgi:low affinity Fe/Cu permease
MEPHEHGVIHVFFSHFSAWVAKWTGSHWALTIAALLVLLGLVIFGIDITNVGISIVTLLMVFVLQNTQNRDSAALHLKLDEVVRAEPQARDDVQGVESKSEGEIKELHPSRR